MGPVNAEAIHEYDELEERFKFLSEQHEDLVKAKEQLLQVIAKINSTTKQLFSETFEKIRENFQVMFTELFGGGKANLILLDENDPLESGIEIVAKPPGKQLQSITLLSGGEKTLTATALLFSIYMVKPSAFFSGSSRRASSSSSRTTNAPSAWPTRSMASRWKSTASRKSSV
jgi:chromosome segregation protein